MAKDANKQLEASESAIRNDLDQVRGDLDKLRSDIGSLARALKTLGTTKAGEAKSSVEAELQHVIDEVRGRSRQAGKAVEREVHEHPISALLAAFGIGFVLGKLLDRS